ncbi:MAG: hypothetical protein KAR23_02395 [Candidatus Aenigmarchaeota archaeon]|nr:hypothetical protein [Candidatus Aenigmarchaeota archaeon]
MGYKRLFVILSITVTFLLALAPVFSVLSCNVQSGCSGTTVYRMYRLSNSHAELYTGSEYSYSVCCEDVIDDVPTGIDLNNDCYDAHILNLSAQTNAHVEQNDQSIYNYGVCLSSDDATVTCSYETQPCADVGYQACLGTFSAPINAHVSDCVTSPYLNYICCNISYGFTCSNGVFSLNGRCNLACGADSECDGKMPGEHTDGCDMVGDAYFIDVCNSACEFVDDPQKICNSTGDGCVSEPECDGLRRGECFPDGIYYCDASCINQTAVGNCITKSVVRKALVYYTTQSYNREFDIDAMKCLIRLYLGTTCTDPKLEQYLSFVSSLPDSILPN